jgi:UDP:flavonoid glycosyltransferase YjiC (YdhE family)
MVAPKNFRSLVEARGLEFSPFRIDSEAILSATAGRSLAASGDNIVRATAAAFNSFGRLAEQYVADLSSQSLRDTDAIINQLPGSVFGYDLAQKLGVPHIVGSVIPMTPTGAFPMIGFQSMLSGVPGYNPLTYVLAEQVLWQFFRKATNRWRSETLDLPRASFWGHYKDMRKQKVPVLNGFSRYVVPRPADWGDNVKVTGYWFDQEEPWESPDDLRRFITNGKPPVFIGFGSMPIDDQRRDIGIFAEALRQLDLRGVVSAGWGGLSSDDLPDHLFRIDYTPYSQLFPRMSAIVHHGGSGTTATGLRAGIPSVLVPFVFDQFYWGDRLRQLGVSPRPIPHKKLTVERLVERLDQAIRDKQMRRNASALGERIRTEDGVKNAVDAIMQYLQKG